MIDTELQQAEKTVALSPRALELVCPERMSPGPRSRLARLATASRLMAKRLATRAWFRLADLQDCRCRAVEWRLRARLAWVRWKYRGRLNRPRT